MANVKIGDMVKTFYQGRDRICKVIRKAPKASKKRGELIWNLELVEADRGSLTSYHWRFMKPDRLLQAKVINKK